MPKPTFATTFARRLARTVASSSLALSVSAGALGLLATGCEDFESPTELNPEGPPMIRQLILNEIVVSDSGAARRVQALAFGSHPEFVSTDDGVVTTGDVASNQKIRIVVDELLVGNYLEQIQCRDGSYQSVPVGATPDDIAACSVANDVLPQTCTGRYAVCLDGDGQPIGVMDENEDGASDDTQFIDGAVRVICDDIDVPMSRSGSFWQPSGNQQVPAAGGFNAVGPAIILAPLNGMPTSSTCRFEFDPSVVDKDGNRLCAPPEGDVTRACASDGDVSQVTWGTEGMRVTGTSPANGQTAVALGSPDAVITVQFNTSVAADGGGNVDTTGFVLLEGTTPRTDLVATRDMNNASVVSITVPGGYAADTEYTLQITGDVTDTFGKAIPESNELTVMWTTAASAQ